MKRYLPWLVILASATLPHNAFAYGSSGGGGSSCSEPRFSDESPKNESTVKELKQFTVEASKNTDLKTLEIEVDGIRQEATMTTLRTGASLIDVSFKQAKTQASKVRITLRAKSDEGCEAFQPYYIHIQP